MERYIPNYYEIDIVESFAKSCEAAIEVYSFEIHDYFTKIMQTHTFDHYYESGEVFSQAPTHIVNDFVEVLADDGIQIQTKQYTEGERLVVAEDAYWVGYLILCWVRQESLKGKELLEQYDMKRIVSSYEPLHRMSVKNAIEDIKEEYERD